MTSTSRWAVPERIGLLSQPTTTRGGPCHYARTRSRGGRYRLGGHCTADPPAGPNPSVGMPPTEGVRSRLLRRHAGPPGHRLFLGGRRTPVRPQGVGHHDAGPAGRVDPVSYTHLTLP